MKNRHLKTVLSMLVLSALLFACTVEEDDIKNLGGGKAERFTLGVTTVGENHVELAWNALRGVKRYMVMVSTRPDGEFREALPSNTTNGSVKMLLPAKQYYFKVVEMEKIALYGAAGGNIYGRSSGIVKVVTKAATLLQAPVVTSTVTQYSATLSWDAVAGATSYNIYRMDVDGGEFPFMPDRDTSALTFKNEFGLESGKSYTYKVVAYNADTNQTSSPSAPHDVRIKAAAYTLPKITPVISSYELSWNLPLLEGKGQFIRRYRYIDATRAISDYVNVVSTKQFQKVDGYSYKPGESYYFRFRLVDEQTGAGSPLSEIVKVTVPKPELTLVPQNLNLDSTDNSPGGGDFVALTFSWDAVPGAELYHIYEYAAVFDSYVYIDSTTTTTFTAKFGEYELAPDYSADILVRAVKTSTKEAGPFSAPLKVKIK